jgi:hypothetical protein
MTEVHEILVILNVFSLIAHVCVGYHVHSYSAPSRKLCVIQAYVASLCFLWQMILWLFNIFLYCGDYILLNELG